jgi:prepilin-type N-terminal cleavage/methylation domain-containing protein
MDSRRHTMNIRDARPRAGFTMVELLIAILVAGIVAAAAWSLAEVGTSIHVRELRRADVERTRNNLEGSVGRTLAQISRGGFSSPNLGMVRAGVGQSASGSAADTLVLLRGTSDAVPIASRPCIGALPPACIVLRGDRRETLRNGDVIAVGSSRVGYRLLQVTSISEAYAAPCGADCPAATYCPAQPTAGLNVAEVLFGTRSPGGTTTQSCSESFYPDGSRCVETRAIRAATPRTRSVCAAATSRALFTEVRTTDRTATAGYPAPREWSGISGAGLPSVAAMRVELIRINTVPEGTELAITMARGLTAAGAWNAPHRVAGPIASFEIETQHVADAAWQRGDGVIAATLATPPNRVSWTLPGAGKLGFTYARGYHTMVAVRINIDVVGADRAGTRTTDRIRLLQSLAPLAHGGAREEP